MKRSYLMCAALAAIALSSAMGAVAAVKPVDPGGAQARTALAVVTPYSQEATQTAAAAPSKVVQSGEAFALFTTPLASKPAHGGYPGHVITHTGTVRGFALRSFPLANQPGYAKPAWRT